MKSGKAKAPSVTGINDVSLADVMAGRASRSSPQQITYSERGNLQGLQFFTVAGARHTRLLAMRGSAVRPTGRLLGYPRLERLRRAPWSRRARSDRGVTSSCSGASCTLGSECWLTPCSASGAGVRGIQSRSLLFTTQGCPRRLNSA